MSQKTKQLLHKKQKQNYTKKLKKRKFEDTEVGDQVKKRQFTATSKKEKKAIH